MSNHILPISAINIGYEMAIYATYSRKFGSVALAVETQADAKRDGVKPGSEFFYAGLMA
jgi:hypothetical protein